MSETLVRWITEEKGKSDILYSMKTRRDFLETKKHRIRLVFTPKHC